MAADAFVPVLMEFDWRAWLDKVPEGYRPWLLYGAIGLVALLVLRRAAGWLLRFVRGRRPVTINPKLQKYNIDHAELDRQRREQAAGIIATSTGNRLAGFRMVRQVEAVFVEGYRSPEDAIIALKAAAVGRGANAILNVHTERTTAGRCTASGDAVVVAPLVARMPQRRPAGPEAAAGADPAVPGQPPADAAGLESPPPKPAGEPAPPPDGKNWDLGR